MNLTSEDFTTTVKRAAQLLDEGKFIGWFQGASEIGPRALGNRSILADPRLVDGKDVLNERIKKREEWRPYAPAILEEVACEWTDLPDPVPLLARYMLLGAKILEEKRELVPAITHEDGSTRPQTVTKESNLRFYALLRIFNDLTGVPILLNTSFNAAGEPIVETPQDAIRAFEDMDLDAVVVGDYLVER